MAVNTIYGLIDPRTGECRYVGKTSQGMKVRLRRHLKDALKVPGSRRCASWIASLMKLGHKPEFMVIDECESNWEECEIFWIAYFRFIGANLTNMRAGGGSDYAPLHSTSARRRISEAAKRQFSSPEARANAALYGKRAWADPGFVQRRRALAVANAQSAEYSEKQRQAKLRLWSTEPYRTKVTAAQRRADHSSGAKKMWERPEYREAQRLAREKKLAPGEARDE